MEITTSLVDQLIATQFPQWANLPIQPVALSGWDNRTFHLGKKMLVRLPSAEWYAAQVEKEQHWLPKLAAVLPLPIPAPVAMGKPAHGYPWHWSIYEWIDGENATMDRIADPTQFAATLAQFLIALQKIDTTNAPPPGEHNFFRGGSLAVYDNETRQTIISLRNLINTKAAVKLWDAALKSKWQGLPVWIHGDISADNLLVKEGRLRAVIDFGCSAIGDPACDLVIAWTFLHGESRKVFRKILTVDAGTWTRAQGWALWKGMITLAEHIDSNSHKAQKAKHVIEEVLADYEQY